MELTEEELELLDPHPDVHSLFVHYNDLYFEQKLGACSVEWSSARMTLCGGVCEYRPGGGCRIKLSEPLLKLRPARDLKMVLLHEMIHAYMMLQGIRDDDPGGHGTIFKSIMERINVSTLPDHQRPAGGMFAEVDHYRQHHWRCERCANVIKRSMNRPPQEADCRLHVKGRDCGDRHCSYHMHLRHCGGTWIKIKEPEGFADKKQKKKGRKAAGSSSSAEAQEGGSAASGSARVDGAPLPAKRPKKSSTGGSGSRPITDFFPTTGASSPAPKAAGRGESGPAAAASGDAGAGWSADGWNSGGGGSAVLPAIQAVQHQAQQQGERRRGTERVEQAVQQQEPAGQQQAQQPALEQQQQTQQPQPSLAERRRVLAEAALRRLGGRKQMSADGPLLSDQQQPHSQHHHHHHQQQQRQQQQPTLSLPQQGRQQLPEDRAAQQGAAEQSPPHAWQDGSPGLIDLAASSSDEAEEGQHGSPGSMLNQHRHHQQQQRQQEQWQQLPQEGLLPSDSGQGGGQVRSKSVGSTGLQCDAPAAVAQGAAAAREGAGVGVDPTVACPVCGRKWPAAELSNAQLNTHVDECLTLSALAG